MSFKVRLETPGGAALRSNAIKQRGLHLAIVCLDIKGGRREIPGYRSVRRLKFPGASTEEHQTLLGAVPRHGWAGQDRGTYFPSGDTVDQVRGVSCSSTADYQTGRDHRSGALWSKEHADRRGQNDLREEPGPSTASRRTGHRVIFDDTDGSE
jgi:hypothetical protein